MVTIDKEIQVKSPVLIAAWPGMGHVAFRAANYLKDKLKAQLFAHLEPGDFFHQTDIVVERQLIGLQKFSGGKFYYWKNEKGPHDIIIFLSNVQPPPEKAVAYAQKILDFAASLKIKRVFTFAAMLTSVDYSSKSKVWLAVTHKKLASEYSRLGLKLLESGQISGLNGLLLGLARKKGLQGTCLLAEIPFYSSQIENPRASLSILSVASKLLGFHVDLKELSLAVKIIEDEVGQILEYAKEMLMPENQPRPITAEDIDQIRNILSSQSKIPGSVKREIEQLFSLSKKDTRRAIELKEKLDEWQVYKDYEDRFLGLFKKESKKDRRA